MSSARRIAVFGGAGFIGSHIVDRLVRRGDRVVVVDGLVPGTGGAERNLAQVRDDIEFRRSLVDTVDDLPNLLQQCDVVVDAMAWTSHIGALADPMKDLKLNLESHLHLLRALAVAPRATVIYLGSRGQYGRVAGVLDRSTPMDPLDVQGIHKTAADQHFRLFSRLHGFRAISVRLPGCFGERQPTEADDIGLVGGFVRTAIAGGAIDVFGEDRRRAVLYARDAAAIVERVADTEGSGFQAVNVGGADISILELARAVVTASGSGRVTTAPLPATLRTIDIGDAAVDESDLRGLIGEVPRTGLDTALAATVAYFRQARA